MTDVSALNSQYNARMIMFRRVLLKKILIESHIHVSDRLIEKLPAQLPIERWFDICELDYKRSIRYRSTVAAQQVRLFFRNLVR
jgi:hypothetical protein